MARILAVLVLSAALAAACGGGGGATPTATLPVAPSATAPSATEPPVATALPNELGEAPIFWRTADGFATLTAGVPYKVVLRVTNGYDEPELTIVAQYGDGSAPASIEFVAERVEAGAGEAPGAYYAANIELPVARTYQLTARAGADVSGLTVAVLPES